MPDKLSNLLIKAQKLYDKGDRHKGASLIEKILKKDFDYSEAWKLLYKQYGSGQSFEEFKQAFIERYYPEKLFTSGGDHSKAGFYEMDEEGDTGTKPSLAQKLSAPLQNLLPSLERQIRRPEKSPETAREPQESQEKTTDEAAKPDIALRAESPPNTLGADTRPPPKGQPPPAYQTPPALQMPSALKPPFSLRAPVSQQKGPQKTPPPIETNVSRTEPPQAGTEDEVIQKIKVLIVDDDPATRAIIIRSLSFKKNLQVIGTAENGVDGIQTAMETRPDVILMDVNMPEMDGITATERILSILPQTQVVILTVQGDANYIRRAMTAGARDFLTKPPLIDDLLQAVQQAGEIAHKEKSKLPAGVGPSTSGIPSSRGKIITLYSPKGGIGRTTLAVNMSVGLCRPGEEVVIVDSKLEYGDVSILFDEKSKNTLVDLVYRAGELDPQIVREVLIEHESGVKILAGSRMHDAEQMTESQLKVLLNYLKTLFTYIIVDTGCDLNDYTLAALDISDLILVLVNQDVSTIERVRKFLDLVSTLEISPQKILLVINQFDQRIHISPERISHSYQREIAAVIPADSQLVTSSINHGVPFMLDNKQADRPIFQAVQGLSETVRRYLSEQSRADLLSRPGTSYPL
jgi:pilus assembly protein CpaE